MALPWWSGRGGGRQFVQIAPNVRVVDTTWLSCVQGCNTWMDMKLLIKLQARRILFTTLRKLGRHWGCVRGKVGHLQSCCVLRQLDTFRSPPCRPLFGPSLKDTAGPLKDCPSEQKVVPI